MEKKRMPLQHKIIFGYIILVAVIGSMIAILIYERRQMREVEGSVARLWRMYEEMCIRDRDIPASVTKVGNSAFSDSGITSLDLSNVKEFEGFCFSGCKALKTVKLNSSLKENFLMETYQEFTECPLLEVKYINNE